MSSDQVKQLNFDSISSTAMAVFKGHLDIDIPTPRQNAIEEKFNAKVNLRQNLLSFFGFTPHAPVLFLSHPHDGLSHAYIVQLQPDEMFDDDCFGTEASDASDASDEERAEDEKTDHMDVLYELGCLAPPPQNAIQHVVEDEKHLRDLLVGLSMINQGNKLTAAGSEKVRQVVLHMPSLHKLSSLLGSVQSTDASLLSTAKHQSKIPNTHGTSVPIFYKPRKVENRFHCRICSEKFGSWTGCDSHIRSTHTHIKYGPCRSCCKFVSSNYDAFRKHEKTCKNNSPSGMR